jgi:O-methyltransferase
MDGPMNRRQLAYRLYPRSIGVFDSLNKNVAFERFAAATFIREQQVPDRLAMYEAVNRAISGGGPIDYFEFGVAEGESITSWAAINSNPMSRFFGFDSFEGLPEDWTKDSGAGAFSTGGRVPVVHDDRVTFVKGLFQASLRTFLMTFAPINPMIVHVDADLYSSTLFVLATMDELMLPGSAVMFDEFYSLRNEFDAWCDYARAYYRRAAGLAFTPRHIQVALKLL